MAVTAKTLFETAGWLVLALMTPCIGAAQSDSAPNSKPRLQDADPGKPAADGAGSKAQGIIEVGPGSSKNPQTLHTKLGKSLKQEEQERAFTNSQAVAKEMLQNLDQVIEIAHNAGIDAPSGWVSANQGLDAYSQRRIALKGQLDQARDQLSAAAVAEQTSVAIGEILKSIAANTSRGSPEPSRNIIDRSASPRLTGLAVIVSLCMAGASLIMSFLALWRGWFVTRRQVDKALTDAGLL